MNGGRRSEEEVERGKKKKLGGRNLQQRFYKNNYFWPQFCDVVGSSANFFIRIFFFLANVFWTKGICNTISFSQNIFHKMEKKNSPPRKKRKKKKPSEKGRGLERKKFIFSLGYSFSMI